MKAVYLSLAHINNNSKKALCLVCFILPKLRATDIYDLSSRSLFSIYGDATLNNPDSV